MAAGHGKAAAVGRENEIGPGEQFRAAAAEGGNPLERIDIIGSRELRAVCRHRAHRGAGHRAELSVPRPISQATPAREMTCQMRAASSRSKKTFSS